MFTMWEADIAVTGKSMTPKNEVVTRMQGDDHEDRRFFYCLCSCKNAPHRLDA